MHAGFEAKRNACIQVERDGYSDKKDHRGHWHRTAFRASERESSKDAVDVFFESG